MSEALKRSGKTKRELARIEGVSDASISKRMSSERVGLDAAIRALRSCGYRVYAVPDSIILDSMITDAIEIETAHKEKADTLESVDAA